MKISKQLTDDELLSLQNQFYSYFDSPYDFELFLKAYLTKIGLDEVEVTQKSRDGGIDLIAKRNGIGDFSKVDVTNYYIQAKRYNLKNTISVKTLRELKGTTPFGHKGILITTSKFSQDTIKESASDPSKPVILIDGKSLTQSCIDNEIGFVFKPMFSNKEMDSIIQKENLIHNIEETKIENFIEKEITLNDIRARIISIPSTIRTRFDDSKTEFNVIVNKEKNYVLKLNKDRNFFSSVTQLLRDFNLLSSDGIFTSKKAKWYYDKEKQIINLFIE